LALLAASCTSGQDSDARAEAIRFSLVPPTSEEVIEYTETFEEAVARCMIAAGFDYVPEYMDEEEAEALVADQTTFPPIEEPFGVPTYGFWEYLTDEEVTDGVIGSLNEQRVAQLTPSEQDAYYQTLFGDAGPPEEDPAPDYGCRGVGFDAVGNPAEQYADEIDQALNEVENRLAASPRLIEALDVWRTCMADKGYDEFLSPDQALLFVEEIFYNSGGRVESGVVSTESAEIETPEPAMPEESVMESVRATEIEIASLDKSCDEESGLRDAAAEERARIVEVVLSDV
jgi:hypothetical protein